MKQETIMLQLQTAQFKNSPNGTRQMFCFYFFILQIKGEDSEMTIISMLPQLLIRRASLCIAIRTAILKLAKRVWHRCFVSSFLELRVKTQAYLVAIPPLAVFTHRMHLCFYIYSSLPLLQHLQ